MKLRIGGVPEHFNFPWHYGKENRLFEKAGLDIEWIDVPGGSGAMTKMLANNELDFALVLTEGIVKHIAAGGKSRIIHQFVKSPLIWGIHSATTFNANTSLSKARFARSRPGSGSHIMAYVLAEDRQLDLGEEHFVTVGNIDGAEKAFKDDEADILLWEKFMTKPLVEAGKMNRIGDLISPWPCFMLVGSEQIISQNEVIQKLSDVLISASNIVSKRGSTIKQIADFYNLKEATVADWYTTVEWQTSDWISSKMLNNVITTLNRIGLIPSDVTPESLCYSKVKLY